jgi:hypothetical protein
VGTKFMSDDDDELVALIDNELDEDRRTALLARLAADNGLRQRYEELRQTGAPLAASFDVLLEQAPLARLRTALSDNEPIRRLPMRFAGIALRELAVGLVIGAFAAGAAIWAASTFGLFDGREDWRTAIAEYTHLYTNETFSPLKPDAMQQAAELKAIGAMVGANLTLRPRTWPCRTCGSRPRSCFPTEAHRWASLLMSTLRALRSCFASSPTARRTRLLDQRDAATCRSLGGRVTAAAIW